jgi:hypothetical protein
MLAPKYCGPFEFLDRIVLVPHILAFPTSIRDHNVFHVSLLENYVDDPNNVIDWDVI